jgi:hypothetical protein
MALRMGALYDALRQAQGIGEDEARKAAEEVAQYENRLARIDARLDLLTWMVGTAVTLVLLNFAATLTVLYRLAST